MYADGFALNATLLSIVVPVYNAEPFLHKCVDSVLNQKYQNIEIVLVNDGSEDKSGQICDEYALKDKRVIVIHQRNKGQIAATLRGIKHAQGLFVTFVDSDDWVETDIYYSLMNKMLEDGDIDIGIGTLIREYPDGNLQKIFVRDEKKYMDRADAIEEMFSYRLFGWEKPGKIYRKEILLKVQPLQGLSIMEDFHWNWNLFRNAKKIYYEGNESYHYYYNNKSVTSKGPAKWADKQLDVIESFVKSPFYELGIYGKRFLKQHLRYDFILYFEQMINKGTDPEEAFINVKKRIMSFINEVTITEKSWVVNMLSEILDNLTGLTEQFAQMSLRRDDIANIYLYGAGRLADISACILLGYGLPYSGCIISDSQKKNEAEIYDKPIFFLSEIVIKDKDLVVLTSAAAYDAEILPNLTMHGIRNIYKLTGWRERLKAKRRIAGR